MRKRENDFLLEQEREPFRECGSLIERWPEHMRERDPLRKRENSRQREPLRKQEISREREPLQKLVFL